MKHIPILLLLTIGLQPAFSQRLTIWPGDVNNNGIVNEVDVLFWGFAFGETGPPRQPRDATFLGYPSDSVWTKSFPEGPNFAYADANGDGIVDRLDLEQAIKQNWGLMQGELMPDPFFVGTPGQSPPLTLSTETRQVEGGQEIAFTVSLGDMQVPVDSFYGLSFRLHYDPDLVVSGDTLQLEIPEDSWLSPGEESNVEVYARNTPAAGLTQVAVTRLNQQTVGGFGQILKGIIVVEDIIFRPEQDTFRITVDSVKLVTSTLAEVPTVPRSLAIPTIVSSSPEVPVGPNVLKVFPNPVRDHLRIEIPDGRPGIKSIKLINLQGELMRYVTFRDPLASYSMQTDQLPPSIYIILAETRTKTYNAKIFIH